MTNYTFFVDNFVFMNWQLHPKMNDKLFIRDPELSPIGRNIISSSVKLINNLGFELFTFKKLAEEISTTEATVYRYFENKHRLLNYIVSWYWHWLDYQVEFHTQNLTDTNVKITKINAILTWQLFGNYASDDFINLNDLHQLIVAESSKVYLTKHVSEDNKAQLFFPYKALCHKISTIYKEHNPDYPYCRSLASTVLEMAHFQNFFMNNLPSLTDFSETKNLLNIKEFLDSLVFSSLNQH